jgi:hypothetical protein
MGVAWRVGLRFYYTVRARYWLLAMGYWPIGLRSDASTLIADGI